MELIPIKRLQMSGSTAGELLAHAPRRLEARPPVRACPLTSWFLLMQLEPTRRQWVPSHSLSNMLSGDPGAPPA